MPGWFADTPTQGSATDIDHYTITTDGFSLRVGLTIRLTKEQVTTHPPLILAHSELKGRKAPIGETLPTEAGQGFSGGDELPRRKHSDLP